MRGILYTQAFEDGYTFDGAITYGPGTEPKDKGGYWAGRKEDYDENIDHGPALDINALFNGFYHWR